MPLKQLEDDHKTKPEVVQRIRANDHKILSAIYKETYPMVEKYILANSGSIEDSKDIFQDAFYLFIQKTNAPDFELTARPSTFLFGISKNLWLKTLTKKKLDLQDLATEQNFHDLNTEEDQEWQKLNRIKQIKHCVMALGEPCKTIIEQFYFLESSMKKIAELLHYSTPEHAKNQKYKCFIRLKKMITINSEE